MVELAVEHDLIIFSDEIYEKIVYNGAVHYSPALMTDEVLCVTFNGLSKAYRAAGFRAGWMLLTGPVEESNDYREGLTILSNMRLCSNVPSQYVIQTALGGYQSIDDLIKPGGRLFEQMETSWKMIQDIPGMSCVKPQGALYLFPKVDIERFNISDDEQFVLDLLKSEKILLVQGTGFNWKSPDHFRIVFLPPLEVMKEALTRLRSFLEHYKQ
jgi:alanine-synthesizing transaminase